MRIIKRATLVAFWQKHPQAESGLRHWHKATKAGRWTRIQEVRAVFPHADSVTVKSGRRVVVFNIGGNNYRLITAIHYNRQLVFTLMVLTHRVYDQGKWKEVL